MPVCLCLNLNDRAQLQALITDRNTRRKLVWRAEIVLATADGYGTNQFTLNKLIPVRYGNLMA